MASTDEDTESSEDGDVEVGSSDATSTSSASSPPRPTKTRSSITSSARSSGTAATGAVRASHRESPLHLDLGNAGAGIPAAGSMPESSSSSSPSSPAREPDQLEHPANSDFAERKPIASPQPRSRSESLDSVTSELPLDFGEDSPAAPSQPHAAEGAPSSPERPKWRRGDSGLWFKEGEDMVRAPSRNLQVDEDPAKSEGFALAEPEEGRASGISLREDAAGTLEATASSSSAREYAEHKILEPALDAAEDEAFTVRSLETDAKTLAQEAAEVERQEAEKEARKRQAMHEEAFWAALTPQEAERVRGMLQAIGLYQQHLRHNERVIDDLSGQIAGGERRFRSLRRKVQQASQDVDVAREQEANFSNEVVRWNDKRERYESSGSNVLAVRAEYAASQSECNRCQEELEPLKVQLRELRERLADLDGRSRDQESNLQTLASNNKQALASISLQHFEEMSALQTQQTEELSKLEVDLQSEVSTHRSQNADEASRLRCILDDVNRRMERLRQERDEATDHFLSQQREGARLQQQYADAREEVLDLASQVRTYQSAPRVASQLGMSLDGSMASLSFLPLPGDDPNLDAELEEIRRQCKFLERECSRTHDALERKQTECERWRRRSLETAACRQPISPVSEGVRRLEPFTLGPGEGEATSALTVL